MSNKRKRSDEVSSDEDSSYEVTPYEVSPDASNISDTSIIHEEGEKTNPFDLIQATTNILPLDQFIDLPEGSIIENIYSDAFNSKGKVENVTLEKLPEENLFKINAINPRSNNRGERYFPTVNVKLEVEKGTEYGYFLINSNNKKCHLFKSRYVKKVDHTIRFTGKPSTKRRRRSFESLYEEANILGILGLGIRKRKSKKNRKRLSKKKKTKAHKKNKKTRKH